MKHSIDWDDSLISAGKEDILSHRKKWLREVIVNLHYKLSELSVQWPYFLLNKTVLTWEECDKRILHSTLQADLWVTKDINEKGDTSSLWCSQAGELFGRKPCTKTQRESLLNESSIPIHPATICSRSIQGKPLWHPPGHMFWVEIHRLVIFSQPLPCPFLRSHEAWKRKEKERELNIYERW